MGWLLYAQGFLTAAEAACEHLLKNRQYTDFVVYPVLFLYRHYLEISLKALADDSLELLRREPQGKLIHGLRDLWEIAKKHLTEVLSDPEGMAMHLEVIEGAVAQFQALDPSGQGSRYPWGTKGERVLFAPERISVQNLRNEMANVAQAIDQLGYILGARLDEKNQD